MTAEKKDVRRRKKEVVRNEEGGGNNCHWWKADPFIISSVLLVQYINVFNMFVFNK